MRAEVNEDLCEGHGKCEKAAPKVFELRDDDLSYVLVNPIPAEEEDNVRRAFRVCPRAAIVLHED